MQDMGWLRDLVAIFGVGIIVVVACHRIKIPTLIGFLLTGILAGPAGFGVVRETKSVQAFAEIGVVLLLFTIGIEFSVEKLLRIRWVILVGGSIQVIVTTVVVAALATTLVPLSFEQGILAGMLVALSSTAIVLKIYSQKAELETPHARVALGILIFQDLCVVPMMLALPLLSGSEGDRPHTLEVLLKAAGLSAALLIAGRYAFPWILAMVVKTRSREAFLLAVVCLCLGTAWLSSLAGLSLALGAFIAGLLVSRSEYSHQALGQILPFHDIFTSLFLVSIGMLLDLHALANVVSILVVVVGILVLKTGIAAAATFALRYPLRTNILAGLGLAQIGEFSFVLALVGLQEKILDERLYQIFLGAAVITMILTPVLHAIAPSIADAADRMLRQRLPAAGFAGEGEVPREGFQDHVIIVGFGFNGKNLAKALRSVSVPYAVLEMNAETVRRERKSGEPILYGDASMPEVLEHAGIRRARALVIAISDAASTRRAIDVARRLQPGLHIIVRTRFVQETAALLALGANEVVPEEFETSVEIFARTLRRLLVPRDTIDRLVREARADGYGLMRSDLERNPILDVGAFPAGMEIEALRVEEGSAVAGKTLLESDIRKRTGAIVLALRHGSGVSCNPPNAARLDAGTVAVIFGASDQVAAAAALLRGT